MSKNTNTYSAVLLIVFLVIGLVAGYYLAPTKTKVVNTETQLVVTVPANNTNLTADVAKIKAEVFKVDTWKDDATDIAESELEYSNYRHLFEFLEDSNVSIVDKEDISRVVIKDSDVTSYDVDNEDAVVVLNLKVYYENSEGDDKKVYVDATYTITDGDVDDEVFALA